MELPTSGEVPSGRVQDWVVEARGGSRAALGRILELCRQYLLLVANRELEPELWAKGGASDLVQETFLEAQKDFASFQGTTRAEVLAWLRRILLNNVSNFRRRYVGSEKRQILRELSLDRPGMSSDGRFAPALDTPSPSGRAAANEESRALDRALERLPADYREVILLRHEQALSFADVGRLMDRSEEAARKLWVRAVARLREELVSK
ncbi:MAG TPA: sigma-70 family RNA polymerase sigma factor [Planctomycetaceae bacterium]|jgi:RNA polymerase sigma-70 factor (ECF subfamily)|nr:sigma-70 family RNA polymerase sigma factor [Planctomycetaceae bacterium]